MDQSRLGFAERWPIGGEMVEQRPINSGIRVDRQLRPAIRVVMEGQLRQWARSSGVTDGSGKPIEGQIFD